MDQQNHNIVIGDFNLHHPKWGSDFTPAHHFLAGRLIGQMETAQMDLITPKGTETWARNNSSSTLDLCFMSHALTRRVESCTVNDQLESSSDHYPIQTDIQLTVEEEREPERRLCWKQAEWTLVQQRLEGELEQVNIDNIHTTEGIDQAVEQLIEAMQRAAQAHIPEKRWSLYQKPYWTPECTAKVKEARKARRRWEQRRTQANWEAYNNACKAKKAQIRRDKTQEWRSTVGMITEHPEQIWRLAEWARKPDEERNSPPQFPSIQDQDGETQTTPIGKAKAFADHFFGTQVEADLSNIPGTHIPPPREANWQVSAIEIGNIIKKLKGNKAPGPDKIPNCYLKASSSLITPVLAPIFTQCMKQGYCPKAFRQSLTCVLRKPQKEDYTKLKSYRPIALLNTLGKLLEKVVAIRLTGIVEEHNLLPATQMGGRQKRSTLTAVELITEQIRHIWHYGNNKVASLLSLDISGAFDNVSHARLLHILRMKSIPAWIVHFVQSFLKDRTTQILLGSFKAPQTPIANTGIPQGSTLSPILFLLFMADLTPLLETANTSASGFVDDTNILAWSGSTEENCALLEERHRQCEKWAREHGAKFAPDKYQLIHFSKAKTKHNLAAPVKIQGFETHPTRELRVLGIWLDPKLSWGPQVKKAQARADTNRQSIERLTASTWGATFTKAQTMYKAIVKPAMLYGAAIWAAEKHIPKRIEDPLNRAQAACLKRVLGAYKSTPHRTMEMESGTAPIREYLQGMRCQYAEKTSAYPAQGTIQAATQRIRTQWERRRRPNRPHMIPQKEADLKTSQEILAALEQREALREQANTGDKGKKKQSQAERIAGHLWETRWNQKPVRPGAPPAARTFGREKPVEGEGKRQAIPGHHPGQTRYKESDKMDP
uniref:RNA-directed DNA polymerase from mobile element jockey n=1 Tax=Passalora fulva TaxID=5499 RepID=A0A9Q8UTM3_PASFU